MAQQNKNQTPAAPNLVLHQWRNERREVLAGLARRMVKGTAVTFLDEGHHLTDWVGGEWRRLRNEEQPELVVLESQGRNACAASLEWQGRNCDFIFMGRGVMSLGEIGQRGVAGHEMDHLLRKDATTSHEGMSVLESLRLSFWERAFVALDRSEEIAFGSHMFVEGWRNLLQMWQPFYSTEAATADRVIKLRLSESRADAACAWHIGVPATKDLLYQTSTSMFGLMAVAGPFAPFLDYHPTREIRVRDVETNKFAEDARALYDPSGTRKPLAVTAG